jgi:hypothetical protein
VTRKDQATTTAIVAIKINGSLLMIAMLAMEVTGWNPKLPAGLGPSLNFDTSTKDINRHSQPSASELIAMIQKKN